MAAYLIVDIEVTDPQDYEEYKRLAAPTVAAYGGRYLVRGGPVEIMEGDWMPGRLVVLEFESLDRARAWYRSPEYRCASQIRHRTARTHMILAAGV